MSGNHFLESGVDRFDQPTILHKAKLFIAGTVKSAKLLVYSPLLLRLLIKFGKVKVILCKFFTQRRLSFAIFLLVH